MLHFYWAGSNFPSGKSVTNRRVLRQVKISFHDTTTVVYFASMLIGCTPHPDAEKNVEISMKAQLPSVWLQVLQGPLYPFSYTAVIDDTAKASDALAKTYVNTRVHRTWIEAVYARAIFTQHERGLSPFNEDMLHLENTTPSYTTFFTFPSLLQMVIR